MQEENFQGLAALTNRELIGKVEAIHWHYRTVPDMDSTEILVYGSRKRAPTMGISSPPPFTPLAVQPGSKTVCR